MKTDPAPRIAATILLSLSAPGLASCARAERAAAPSAQTAVERTEGLTLIDFQEQEAGRPPTGFVTALTGGGAPCTWAVLAAPEPAGAKVLAQTSTDDTDYRFPLCVLAGFSARDASVSVRFRAVAGAVDRAAGLVARYHDPNNYYIVRANALEDNVRLYKVVDGQRKQFAGEKVPVSAGDWHSLRLDVAGQRFAVFLDGKLLFRAEDDTFADAGQVGLWTKADSVTWFDDLRYGPVLPDSPVLGTK